MAEETGIADRLDQLERKLFFVMQTLSLTRQTPDGQTDSRSLTALYKEMTAHAGTSSQTLATVADRAFRATEAGSGDASSSGIPSAENDGTGKPSRSVVTLGPAV